MRKLHWVGNSREQIREFPREVRVEIGYALQEAQRGGKSPAAKPLKGIGGGVFEIVEDFDGDTFRAVYAVKLKNAVYVLHAFQKKSKSGIKTPKQEIDLIRQRLKRAEAEDKKG
jgi:phage-related protein